MCGGICGNKENVNSITLIYGCDLCFNLQLQNQVLDTHKLSKPSDLHPSAVCQVVFAHVAPHQPSLLSSGPTCHPLPLLSYYLVHPYSPSWQHEEEVDVRRRPTARHRPGGPGPSVRIWLWWWEEAAPAARQLMRRRGRVRGIVPRTYPSTRPASAGS
jgi:hypothetical protein